MGCDIHVHVEIKVSGKWLHYNAPTIRRDYELFTKMAGVRAGDDEIDPISQPRGVPFDASDTTEWEAKRYGGEGHSHSYLSGDELRALEQWGREAGRKSRIGGNWFDAQFGWVCGNSLYDLRNHLNCFPSDLEDVRLVFWFDN